MTESFFLVQLIDKSNYNGIIRTLYRLTSDLFTKGISRYEGDRIYINGIEPEPEEDHLLDGSGMDSTSIWLGVGIKPKETFEENVELYKDLCNWIMDFLYLSRFLINFNLKARVFFYVKNFEKGESNSKLSFQDIIDINCDGSSNFQVRYNKYQSVYPLLTKLLECNPTKKLRAIMYNYAISKVGHSGVVDYFFSFATFEGIIHYWAEANGYSDLWGTAIAEPDEQDDIHKNLRDNFDQFIVMQNSEGDKLKQLKSFKDSTFPTDRKIRRSFRQRFKSYISNRLTAELQENEYIQTMLSKFQRIYNRRNEFGHSLETYLRDPGFVEDSNTLMSSIKILMDFELNQFLNNEKDWKFEIRSNNLRENIRVITQDNMLDKFSYDILVQNQSSIYLRDRFDTRNIEKVEFHSKMVEKNDEDLPNIVFSQKLQLAFPQNFKTRLGTISESKIVNAYEDPYWWIITTEEDSHYIFKTFPPTKFTTTSNRASVREKICEIPSKNILSVIKLDFIAIPDDFNIFF